MVLNNDLKLDCIFAKGVSDLKDHTTNRLDSKQALFVPGIL